jgi:hypothetical protein
MAAAQIAENTDPLWRVVKRMVLLVILLVPFIMPTIGLAQFMQGFGEGFQGTSQHSPTRQQQAIERERLKLEHAGQWRQLREAEFQAELNQWVTSLQAWREMTGQPPLSEDQLRRQLDALRVFDWERQYQQAWFNK